MHPKYFKSELQRTLQTQIWMPWSTEQKRSQAKLKHAFSSEEFSLLGWCIFKFKSLTLHHHLKQYLGLHNQMKTATSRLHKWEVTFLNHAQLALTVEQSACACSSSLWRSAHCLSMLLKQYCIVQYCCWGSNITHCFCHSQNYTAGFIHGLTYPRNPWSMTTAKPSKHSTAKAQQFRFWLNILKIYQSKQLKRGSFGFSNHHLHGSIDLNSNVLNLILTSITHLPLLKVYFCKNGKSTADSSLKIVFNTSFIIA